MFTPDGKTAYVGNADAIRPIRLATHKLLKQITGRDFLALTPNGQTLYVANQVTSGRRVTWVLTPVDTATNTPGPPIYLPRVFFPTAIGITP